MRTLRSKLFINVGFILIIVAVMNDILPEFRIRGKVDQMATFLDKHIESIEDKMRKFTSFFVLYNLTQGAVNLEGMSTLIQSQETNLEGYGSLFGTAGEIVSYNPQVSFLRLQNKQEDVKLRVRDVPLYAPQVMPYKNGMFFVRIEGKPLYIAVPSAEQVFFLFNEEHLRNTPDSFFAHLSPDLKEDLLLAQKELGQHQPGSFQNLHEKMPPFSEEMTAEDIWKFLFWNESQWLEKIALIHELCLWHEKGFSFPLSGILSMNLNQNEGLAILSDELLITQPGGPEVPEDALKLVLLTFGKEPDCELVKKIRLHSPKGEEITIGFSISSMVKKMARLSQKPILLTWDGPPLGYTSTGEYFNPGAEGFPFQTIEEQGVSFVTWRGERYVPHEISLKNAHITLMTPEIEALATQRFLMNLKNQLSVTLTFSLLGATLLSFGIALALLHRTARKIAQPLDLVCKAAEELGSGKYEGIELPKQRADTEEVHLLIESFKKMVSALKDRDKIRGILNKAVSKEVTEQLLNHDIELGGEDKVLTMLFSDIRNFTKCAEHLEPQMLIQRLNSYLTRMCRIIDQTKGVVDKFVGDGIMALYGAPLPMENHPIHAITAALKMLQELRAWNEESGQGPRFEVGIGIHTGNVCVGNMGAENRQNYTVIGANVNLASRLCGFAKPMQILISEETKKAFGVEKTFKIKALEPATLKGIDHPVPIFEVTGFL